MKYVLIAVGSRGDVQPFIALGLGLKAAGHHVGLVAFEPFADFVRSYGLEFVSLGKLPEQFKKQPRFHLNFTGITGRALFWLFYRRILSGYLDRFEAVCEGADVIVFSRLAFPVYHVAEKMRVPCFYAAPVPHTPTQAFVDPLFTNSCLARFPTTRRISFMLEDVFTHQSTAGAINRWRRDVLGLAPVPRRHLTRHRDAMTRATLYGYSPAVLTRPEEWPSNVYVTGFWFLDQPEVWTPGPVLRNFLAAGPPPVYIGFGSMALPDSAKTMQKIAAALLQTGQRAIIAMGVHTSPIQDSENIFILREDVPQDWLFPQVSVVIHHGGVGTMAAAMRAGKPTLVIPINYDQPFWGEIVALLGLGPEAMPARHISVKKLGTAIQKLGTDLNFHHNAVELSKQINAENGVVAAIHVMEEATTECFLP